MEQGFDAVSVGHLDVEFFRLKRDDPYDHPSETLGPFPGGPTGIFTGTLAKLGAKAGLIATVGQDDFGSCIITKLKSCGVDTSHIVELDDVATGTAFTSYDSHGGRKFIFHLGNAAPGRLSREHLDASYLRRSRWLHLSGNVLALSACARDALYEATRIAAQAGIPVSLDPNLRFEIMRTEEIGSLLDPVLRHTTLLLPSLGEIPYLAGTAGEPDGVARLLSRGIKVIARKEGKRGSTVFTGREEIQVPAFPVEEVDPTGCGDAYSAGFVYGMLQNWPLRKTAEFANAVGAITATQRGSMEGITSLADVVNLIRKQGVVST